ncbi:MAG TPA: DUF4235 domain-containing protein [Actinomycetales bacterium]|nr:DUF4235 domain-containing protein [Actinomycetales bacterium]
MGAVMWKVLGVGSAVLAGIAARKVLTSAWKAGTGHSPPSNPESPDTSWKEAVAWAVVSGAAVGIARLMATRKAAEYYRRSAGHLPKNLEEVSA